jgi:pimeloyl-ACP methyl ester carboxylesterase
MTWTTVRAADALRPKNRLSLEGTEGFAGCELAYLEEGGDGDPAVLWVHDFPGNAYDWREILSAGSTRLHSVAADLLGTGESRGPQAANFSLRAQCRCLSVLIAHLRLRDVALVGCGIGGFVCQALALLQPGVLRGVVLLDPPLLRGGGWRFWAGSRGWAVASSLARWGYGDVVVSALTLSRYARQWTFPRRGRLEETDPGGSTNVDLRLRPLTWDAESRSRTAAFLAAIRPEEATAVHDAFARWNQLPVTVGAQFDSTEDSTLYPGARTLNLPQQARSMLEESPQELFELLLPDLGGSKSHGPG